MYYSPDSTGIVVSPTDAVLKNQRYSSWTHFAEYYHGKGYVKFSSSSGLIQDTVPLIMLNNLWFLAYNSTKHRPRDSSTIINSLQQELEYKIWHHHLAHPGHNIISAAPNSCNGLPASLIKLKFNECETCIQSKIGNKKKGYKLKNSSDIRPGTFFEMDFAFVQGPSSDGKKGHLHTCRNGYNCYLLIIDVVTRLLWAFPSSGKDPPCKLVQRFLNKFGSKDTSADRKIRTDNGGKLSKSLKFKKTIEKSGFRLENTAPTSSFQNSIVERAHGTIANMMKAMLVGASLDAKFWSDTLLHATYVKNKLPHRSLQDFITPYEAWTKSKPDISHLRVFRSTIYVKTPGVDDGKIDTSRVYKGIFLGFTASKRNVKYYNIQTKISKISRHFVIDEAHFCSTDKILPYAKDLLEYNKSKSTYFTTGPARKISSQPNKKSFSATAATLQDDLEILLSDLHISSSAIGPTIEHLVKIKGDDEFLRFRFKYDNKSNVIINNIEQRTPANKIPRWRTELRFATLISIDGVDVTSIPFVSTYIEN